MIFFLYSITNDKNIVEVLYQKKPVKKILPALGSTIILIIHSQFW